jgi:cysteine dioxygenase
MAATGFDASAPNLTVIEQVSKLLDAFQFDLDAWSRFAFFQSVSYTRILLHTDHHFSVMMLCWQPGQGTPVHGHGFREFSWVKVLKGALVQRLYRVEGAESQVEFASFRMSENSSLSRFRGGSTLHCIRNDSADVCISLHIYVPQYIECAVEEHGRVKLMPIIYREIDEEFELTHSDEVWCCACLVYI